MAWIQRGTGLFFPDNLRHLLNVNVNNPEQTKQERTEELTEKFMSMIQV